MPRGDGAYSPLRREASPRALFGARLEPASPINPTTKVEENEHGEVHALQGSVHTTHSQRDNPGRQKTYLIATYTGVIEAEDVEQDWFIPSDPESRDKRGVDCPAQREPLVKPHVAVQIQRARAEGKGAFFFDESPADGADPWKDEPSATSTHTDAGVTVRLIGTHGESDELVLVHEAGVNDSEMVFQPGGVDEFAVTCRDIGDLQELVIQHDNNGQDWSSSRWKLDKVVVTCLQSSRHRAGSGGVEEPSTGDHAETSAKTTGSMQWHFVPRPKWLGCTPGSTSDVERHLQMALHEKRRLERLLEELEDDIDGYRDRLSDIRQTSVSADCRHRQARIRIGQEEEEAPERQPCCSTTLIAAVLLFLFAACIVRLVAYLQEEGTGPRSDAGAGEYVGTSDERTCEASPTLTCTCAGPPIVEACPASFAGSLLPWAPTQRRSLADLCAADL
eukprot:COSAG04_NODE_1446_length_6714_cov_1.824339_1_plen_448_part_00